MDKEDSVKVLTFNTHSQLCYWYQKIVGFLRETMPELVWKIKVNESIDFGTQRWMFLTEYDKKLKWYGYRDIPTYHSVHLLLEKDFDRTMTTILKGE